jgi:hypothetical protein
MSTNNLKSLVIFLSELAINVFMLLANVTFEAAPVSQSVELT